MNIWIEGIQNKEVTLKTASFKEVAEYAETLPEEEQEAVFIAALIMGGDKR